MQNLACAVLARLCTQRACITGVRPVRRTVQRGFTGQFGMETRAATAQGGARAVSVAAVPSHSPSTPHFDHGQLARANQGADVHAGAVRHAGVPLARLCTIVLRYFALKEPWPACPSPFANWHKLQV